MPRKPPKPTTAKMMLLDVLSSTMSSTWPIFSPAEFFTAVPITFFARIAEVCPDAVVMRTPCLSLTGRQAYGHAQRALHRRIPRAPVSAAERSWVSRPVAWNLQLVAYGPAAGAPAGRRERRRNYAYT